LRPIKLSLKNFRGIKDGLGLDHIDIDFSELNQGLTAFVGENGTGKSSFLGQITPYRVVPGREGSYYDHVIGQAEKELIFEMNGSRYRSLILIEPKGKKMEAYLYIGNNGTWTALNDGKAQTYDQQIEKIIGSQKLFFESIFRAQGARPISAHSKSELKELFTELLLLDRYQVMADKAKEHRKQHEIKVEGTKPTIESLNAQIETLEAKQDEKKQLALQLETVRKTIAEKETILESHRKELSALETKKAVQEKEAKRVEELKREVADIEEKIRTLKDTLFRKTKEIEAKIEDAKGKERRAEKILSGKGKIEAALKEEKELESKKESIRRKADQARMDIEGTEKEVERLDQLRNQVAFLEAKTEAEKRAHSADIANLEKEIERNEQTANQLNGIPCLETEYENKCPLISDAVKARDSIEPLKSKVAVLSGDWDPPSLKELNIIKNSCKHLQDVEIKYKERKQALRDLQDELSVIDEALIEVRKFTRLLPELEMAQRTIEEAKEEITGLEKEKVVLKDEMDDEVTNLELDVSKKKTEKEKLLGSLDKELPGRIEDLERQISFAGNEINSLKKGEVDLAGKLGMVEQSLKAIREAQKEVARLKTETKTLEKEISEWALLERALGKDGLIALEIDDAGPAISATANELLQACFGPRFTVKIETTRPTKDGKKMMEVFDIKVLDAESEEEKTIIDLSGGEKVWIQSAITQAIAIRNKELSGRSFLTCVEDECDGALSKENREKYFRMKKKALEIGGFEQFYFVSQSPEVWGMADNKIVFEKKSGARVE